MICEGPIIGKETRPVPSSGTTNDDDIEIADCFASTIHCTFPAIVSLYYFLSNLFSSHSLSRPADPFNPSGGVGQFVYCRRLGDYSLSHNVSHLKPPCFQHIKLKVTCFWRFPSWTLRTRQTVARAWVPLLLKQFSLSLCCLC